MGLGEYSEKYAGMCMGCTADATGADEDGFTFFEMEIFAPTAAPTENPFDGLYEVKAKNKKCAPATGCSKPHHLRVTNVTKNAMTIQSVKHSRLVRQGIMACASAVPPRRSYLPTRDLIRTASFRPLGGRRA